MDAPAYREYAESQGLPAVLSDAVKTVLLEKPADAKAALIKVLSGNEMPAIKAYYTDPFAPNPQLVDIFAREKGFDLEALETKVNILTADNRKGESLKKNPSGQVPYIELVDGTIITETICIMEYIEELQPLPTLIGANGKERALTRMWQRRVSAAGSEPASSTDGSATTPVTMLTRAAPRRVPCSPLPLPLARIHPHMCR